MRAAGIACFAEPTGAILLLRRSGAVTAPGVWAFPAGRLDRGEQPIEAALREFEEETRYRGPIEIGPSALLEEGTFTCFGAIVPHEFTPQLNWENDAAGWYGPATLPFPLHRGVLRVLRSLGS